MSQKYVTDGAWLTCSSGKLMQKLKVESQTTVYMHGKLAATEIDRTGGNFNCLQMATLGALVGAAVATAAIAATILTGGATIGIMAAASTVAGASFTGAIVGSAVSFIPCICSLLTRPCQWTTTHEASLIDNKKALLESAVRPCLAGGTVSIVKTSIKTAIDMAILSDDCYNDVSQLQNSEWKRVPFEEYPQNLRILRLWEGKEKENGFKACLYQNKNGQYTVAFKGTYEPIDVYDDIVQAIGLESEQYKKAAKLADIIGRNLPANTLITGHSLGGGLATIAGAKTNMETYTYNAAGVHLNTLKRYELTTEDTKAINAYSADDDPLSIVQDNRELVLGALSKLGSVGKLLGFSKLTGALPQASGQRIGLETDEIKGTAHGVQPIINVLQEELKDTPTVTIITETK